MLPGRHCARRPAALGGQRGQSEGGGVRRGPRSETHTTEDDSQLGLPDARIRVRQNPGGAG